MGTGTSEGTDTGKREFGTDTGGKELGTGTLIELTLEEKNRYRDIWWE